MALKCAIVGLPNVGKSTLFNALTQAGADAANFPFCTIDPNIGVVEVPDTRLTAIGDIVCPQQTIAATVEFVDIAGLVAGASRGEGLGNAFLGNIRDTQSIIHVVRCFENNDITHVDNKVDPQADAETINTELLLADIQSVQKQIDKRKRLAKSGNAQAGKELQQLEYLMEQLNYGTAARAINIDDELRASLFLLTAKPMIYLANVDEDSLDGNALTRQLATYCDEHDAQMIIVCNALEAEIALLAENEKKEFLEELGIAQAGLDQLIKAGYRSLGLQTFFTAGKHEVRAWTCRSTATAVQAAGVIHSDFARGFIRAEVISYNDYLNCKGEIGAKNAGKWRLEGKEYRVQDGDIIYFRTNT